MITPAARPNRAASFSIVSGEQLFARWRHQQPARPGPRRRWLARQPAPGARQALADPGQVGDLDLLSGVVGAEAEKAPPGAEDGLAAGRVIARGRDGGVPGLVHQLGHPGDQRVECLRRQSLELFQSAAAEPGL